MPDKQMRNKFGDLIPSKDAKTGKEIDEKKAKIGAVKEGEKTKGNKT